MRTSHNSIKASVISSIAGAVVGAIITGGISVFINISNQDTIKKNTVETLSVYFDSVDKDMSYEDALQTIYKENENLNVEINNLKTQLNNAEDQINQQNSQEEINKVIQNATDYWNNSDYVQALTFLKNSKSKSADIESLYEKYSTEYSNNLLLQADSLVTERKRDEAIKLLKEGSILVSNNKEINDKISEINSKPVALLSNLVPVSGTNNDEQYNTWDIAAQDNYGNKYASGIYLRQRYNDKARLVYALDNKYTTLTGKFVLSEDSKNTDGNYILYAYTLVNGEMNILYESPILTTATRPIDVEINVSNVTDLVLEVYDPNKMSNNAWTAFVDAKLE